MAKVVVAALNGEATSASGHAPATSAVAASDGDSAVRTKRVEALEARGFFRVYGWPGLLMVAMFVLSGCWMLALATIQLIPTEVANELMDTAELDYGDFWILAKADDGIAIVSAAVLSLFALSYFGLVAAMVQDSQRAPRSMHGGDAVVAGRALASTRQLHARVIRAVVHATSAARHGLPPASLGIRQRTWRYLRHKVFTTLCDDEGPFLALPKLILQTTTLLRYLREGFPPPVVASYSSLLFVNWMITAFRSSTRRHDTRFVLVRVFYSFDLFFAVFAPLQVLLYAYYNFSFSSDEFATRMAVFPAGNFERTARLFADPTEVSLFRIAFQSLQLTAPTALAVKSALNVFTIRKWKQMIDTLSAADHAHPVTAQPSVARLSYAQQPHRLSWTLWCLQARKRLMAAVVFTLGAGIFVYSIVAITTTQRVCKPHLNCKVLSYRWNVGASQCSCLVFVNRETRMKTTAEWLNPVDTTQSLKELAATGDLKIVQIVNRQLPTLPDELRGCKTLTQLVLLYTKTTALPEWTEELIHLEYFHIQGDFTPKQLTSLPRDLFSSMRHLRFLYLGTLPNVPEVPDLTNLSRLKYLTLAVLHAITKIPSLDGLVRLEQLTLLDAIQVYALPSTAKLRDLRMISLTSRQPVCCNGFVTGKCDLSQFSCLDRTAQGEPLVACTAQRIDPHEFQTLSQIDGRLCDQNASTDIKNTQPTPQSTDQACGGVIYKQCSMRNATGICFPSRLMPIACQISSATQQMRRLQIERKIGDPCDPVVEAWLGCQ